MTSAFKNISQLKIFVQIKSAALLSENETLI